MDKRKLFWVVSAALVFTIPFYLHYIYLLNAFYHYGATINDIGIFATLSWHGDLRLTPPLVFTNYSFYGVHAAPILSFLTALSYLIPTNMAEYYSAFLATVYASIGLALFYAVTSSIAGIKYWQMGAAAVFSGLFAFNNSIMNGIWIGHIEYAIPLGIFLFLLCRIRNKPKLAIAAFVFTLSIREDAGLHLTAVLGLILLIKLFERRSLRVITSELKFITIAVLYSVFAIWITMYARDYWGSTFQHIYSGSPAYAHLKWSLLADRLGLIAEQHINLWVGFVATLLVAIYTRNIYMIVGFAAYIPWFLVNLTAYNDNTGRLYAYYSYPFILSMMWPIIGVILRHGFPLPAREVKLALILHALIIISSIVSLNDMDKSLEFGPNYGARWGSYKTQEGTKNRDMVLKFFDGVQSGKGNLGVVMADEGAITMVRGGKYQDRDLLRVESEQRVDTIIAILPDKNAVPPKITQQIDKNQLPYKYCMIGTTVCLFTNRTAQDLISN